jgi:hypothetical protein
MSVLPPAAQAGKNDARAAGAPTSNPRPAVKASSPGAAWSGMMQALDRGDKEAALAYLQNPQKYDAAFTAMGARMKEVSHSLSGFTITEIAPDYATAVVIQTDSRGKALRHEVSFIFADGRWQIVDL